MRMMDWSSDVCSSARGWHPPCRRRRLQCRKSRSPLSRNPIEELEESRHCSVARRIGFAKDFMAGLLAEVHQPHVLEPPRGFLDRIDRNQPVVRSRQYYHRHPERLELARREKCADRGIGALYPAPASRPHFPFGALLPPPHPDLIPVFFLRHPQL